MADDTNSGWETAPEGAGSLSTKMLMNDAALQANHPNWPTGGTAQQLKQESGSNYNMNAVSPKGAQGMVQAMPETKAAVEQQIGRKLDFSNVNDQLLFHRYLMNQNLDRSNGDPNGALSLYNSGKLNANNPETNNYVSQFDQNTRKVDSPIADGWESAPTQASSDGWESAPKAPDARQQAAKAFLQQAGQSAQGAVGQVQGAGEALGNMASGMVGQVAGGLHSLVDIARGRSDQATADISRDEQALTYQPRTPQGKSIAERAGQVFSGMQGALEQGAQTAMGAIPFVGEDLSKSPMANEVAKTTADVVAQIAPFFMGRVGGMHPAEAAIKDTGAAGELDKLSATQTPDQPQAPMGPTAEEQFNQTPTPYRQYFQQGNLLEDNEGMQPEGPTLAGSTATEAFPEQGPRGSLSDRRQMELQLGDQEPISVNAEGEAMTGQQAAEVAPYRDVMQKRVDDLKQATAQQLDMFNPIDQRQFDQYGPDEAPRSLSPEEFGDTISNLAAKDGTRFPLPEDMDAAYTRYLDTVRDDQGGLFDRPSIAKNFVESAVDEAIDRRVADHPTVKANQSRVDSLQNQLAGMQGDASRAASMRPVQGRLADAQKTLEKSQENIRKFYEPVAKAAGPFVGRDGAVNMYTFGHLPEMFKSIGAVLRALHGVVFKSLDKLIPPTRNLDSGPKIMAQGIKDYVNKQANRDWTQTVNEKPIEQLNKVEALRKGIAEYNPYEAQEISPAELKQQMMQAPDISGTIRSKIAQNIIQGGLQMTNLTRHPLIKFATETVDRAARNSRAYVREALTGPEGLRTKMQALTDDQLTGIRSLMEANEGKKVFSENELRHAGYTDKQIDYYNKSQEESAQALAKHNEARQTAGMKPLDARVGHIAGYFMGDFRQLVTDRDGKVVAVLAHNFRPALQTIAKRFMEDHGEANGYKLEPIKLNKLSESVGASDNRFHGYMEVLNTLKDTNADVKAVVDAYQNYMVKDAQAAMSNRAKFKQSEGVIGAEGRKAWQSAQKNAVDGARQQLKYLESLDKWSEMQKAIQKTKDFLSDPEINAPNAKALAQDYIDSVQGRNRGNIQKLTNAIMNGVAEVTGVGPSVLKGANNLTKNIFLKKFVGVFKLSHSAVTLLQPMQALPTLNARIAARGADLGATSLSSVGKGLLSSFNLAKSELMGGSLSPFEKRAQDFMKANQTTDVGMSNHLENVSKGSARTEGMSHLLEANVRIPEQGARAFTFMYYSHMLKDLGLPEKEVFPTAHNLMRDAMVDYSPHERSLLFGKMGIMGDIASTLTRFKYNQIGQHIVGASDYMKGGSLAPLMTTVLASIVAGGVRGVFGYEMANQAVDQISTQLAKLGVIKNPTSLNEIILHGLHGMNHHLADLLNFGGTASMGVNMTGSLTNADTIPTDPLGALFPTASEFSNLANSAGTFLAHPNKNTASRATLALAPNSMKGMLEDALFTKNGKYMNPNTGKLEATRSTSDEVKRALSFRPLEEGKQGLEANVANRKGAQLNEVKQTVLEHAFSDMSSQGMKLTPQQAQSYAQRYVQLGSDPESFVKELVQYAGMDQNRNRLQRAEGIPGGDLTSVNKYTRAKGVE